MKINSFWHEALDEESSYHTTFGTEFGRFRFTVMQFGITVPGDAFQRKLDTIFSNLQQVACIADDIIVELLDTKKTVVVMMKLSASY